MQKHEEDLQNIDFVDDVDFLESWEKIRKKLEISNSSFGYP